MRFSLLGFVVAELASCLLNVAVVCNCHCLVEKRETICAIDRLWSVAALQSEALHDCFLLLNRQHFFDSLSQVKFLDIFSELVVVQLGKV